MKNLSGQESLWLALPILLVLAILVAGLVLLPQAETEIRSKASEPKPSVITPNPKRVAPEIVCSDLYAPVCGIDNKTYSNSCEANRSGVTSFAPGECTTPSKPTKSQPLLYTLPATN